MKMNENIIKKEKFAYLLGYFMADGCLYKCSRSLRFEFSDGTSIQKELKYSFQFLSYIRNLIQELTDSKLPNIRKRGNKFVLCFRNKQFAEIFLLMGVTSGKKAFTAFIPNEYVNTDLEKYFWLGVMDGDGMVARNSRKISLQMGSLFLINSFKKYLEKNDIKYIERILFNNNNMHVRIDIHSNYFRDYCNSIGFYHPRKKLWILNHLKSDFYVRNKVDFSNIIEDGIFNYCKIFDSSLFFIVDGINLIKRISKSRRNVRFCDVYDSLKKDKLIDFEIFKILNNYRWKMSKGSTVSVKIPLNYHSSIQRVASLVRLVDGGIRISRQYCNSEDVDPNYVKDVLTKLFGIVPKYTSKGELLFCSGVIRQFFAKVINKQMDFSYEYPRWYRKLIVRN